MVHPADPLCGVTGEHPVLCGGVSAPYDVCHQLTLFAGLLVNPRSLRRGFRLPFIQFRFRRCRFRKQRPSHQVRIPLSHDFLDDWGR